MIFLWDPVIKQIIVFLVIDYYQKMCQQVRILHQSAFERVVPRGPLASELRFNASNNCHYHSVEGQEKGGKGSKDSRPQVGTVCWTALKSVKGWYSELLATKTWLAAISEEVQKDTPATLMIWKRKSRTRAQVLSASLCSDTIHTRLPRESLCSNCIFLKTKLKNLWKVM